MTIELESFRTWLRGQGQAATTQIATAHFDELGLVSEDFRTMESVEHLFREGLREAESLGPSFKFLMVFSVRRSRRLLDSKNKNLEVLMSRLLRPEPPVVYLMRPRQYLAADVLEDYRFPLAPAFPSLDKDLYRVYLRQFRDVFYIEKGWEYENGVYFEQICWIDDPEGGERIPV